jgi:hypothetical protein
MSPYIGASFRLIYPEDLTSVPGRADVEVIIFLRVFSWKQATECGETGILNAKS